MPTVRTPSRRCRTGGARWCRSAATGPMARRPRRRWRATRSATPAGGGWTSWGSTTTGRGGMILNWGRSCSPIPSGRWTTSTSMPMSDWNQGTSRIRLEWFPTAGTARAGWTAASPQSKTPTPVAKASGRLRRASGPSPPRQLLVPCGLSRPRRQPEQRMQLGGLNHHRAAKSQRLQKMDAVQHLLQTMVEGRRTERQIIIVQLTIEREKSVPKAQSISGRTRRKPMRNETV